MKKHILPIGLILFTAALWLIFYQRMPGDIPIHWGTNGTADGYAPKIQALLMSLALMVFLYVLMAATPIIDPKKDNYQKFSRSYWVITNTILAFMALLNGFIIYSGLGNTFGADLFVFILVGLLFMVIGNYMQNVRPNYFVGIKTPWTLNNETVWKKTHRLGSRTFMIGGILFILAAFLPGSLQETIIIGAILISGLVPVVYSFWIYKKVIQQ